VSTLFGLQCKSDVDDEQQLNPLACAAVCAEAV
jgi:hypothetical protein